MNHLPSHHSRRTVTTLKKRGLNIGLHAQTLERADGVIAGSEVTTLGLKKAFEKRNDVKRVSRYGPGNYTSLDTDNLDLLVIEGWDTTLPKFIQRVRKHYPLVKIFFWNLSFLGIQDIVRLDVDGYFTNSRKALPILERIAPSRFIMLAVDPEKFEPLEPEDTYTCNVTYLGMFHPLKSPAIIEQILCEAVDYGLTIYGHGWDRHPILKRYWKGRLPFGDIPKLYASAKVVLGMTEERQKVAGMINNRVFEVLSCGACFISEHYPGLEEVFDDTILYSRKKGDTSKYIEELLQNTSFRRTLGEKGRSLILRHHTYEHRVEKMLDFFRYVSNLDF
jgi:glycosyltransferase involved in cell wall biosynthesis